jgi:gliding motility-associated-like protein
MKHILHLLFFCFPLFLSAQIDTEFWFGAPDLTEGTLVESRRDSTVLLVFTTFSQPAQVQILQPANLSFAPIIVDIPANSVEEVDLGIFLSLIETKPANTILNTGLLVRSTQPITAYYEIRTPSAGNADIYALKGKNAMGTKFYTPFQQEYRNNQSLNGNDYFPGPRSGIIVMATDDTTVVSITPAVDLLGHPAGVTFEVELNRGQTYYVESVSGEPGTKPEGTLIESNKPIVVSLKDDMIDLDPSDDSGADIAGDQLIAEEYLGTEHIFVRSSLVNNGDRIVVCGTVDGTELFIDGEIDPIFIDAGEQHIYSFNGPSSYLTSSEKVAVFHIGGFGIQLAGAVVPSLECTGSNQVGFVRGLNRPFFLSITIRAGSEDGFELNGDPNLVPASAFSEVIGTNGEYVHARISFTTAEVPVGQANLLTNFGDELFHLGMSNGNNQQQCNYGYFSAFSFLNIGESSQVCIGDSVLLDAGPGKTSYLWSTGEETQAITVTQPGTYFVEVFSGSDCSATDTITVSYYEPPIDLGPNDTICDGTSLTLQVDGNYLFTWQDGSNNNFFEVSEEGWVWVEVSDFQQCVLRDSIFISVSPRPETPEVLGETEYCAGDAIALSMADVDDAFFRYILPDGSIVFSQNLVITDAQVDDSGLYQGFYVVDGCETFTDSVDISVIASPLVDLGPDISVCEDESVLLDPNLDDGTFEWQDGSDGTTFVPTEDGTYFLSVTNDAGCVGSDTVSVTFRPLPDIPVIEGPTQVCEGSSIQLVSQVQENATYLWTTPDGESISGNETLDLTELTPSQSGVYSVVVEIDGCQSEQTFFELTVFPLPTFSLGPDTAICNGTTIALSGPDGMAVYSWSNDASEATIDAEPGVYTLTVTDLNGCTFAAEILVSGKGPTANFNVLPDFVAPPNTELTFVDQSNGSGGAGIVEWLWIFGDGTAVNALTDENQIHMYELGGVFDATLTVTDADGCSDTVIKQVTSRFNFVIPDGFSPNGDGRNDLFEIQGLEGLNGTIVQIFNRWGGIVYESNDYRPGIFWDGKDSPDGVYFYIVTLPNKETVTGNVTLSR